MSSRFHSSLLRDGEGKTRAGTSTAPTVIPALLVFVALALLSCARRSEPSQVQAQANTSGAIQSNAQPAERRSLRVCADPNNLPFSNEKREGFENRIAELVAREMNLPIEYTWWAQRRGFIRNTLRAGVCDVVIGLPTSYELALTTAPYYRSTYAFVYRRDSGLKVRSFDDEVLRRLKIGVQLIGDDLANTPPAHALSNRQIVENVKGYTVYGDYAQQNPPARIIEAVAKGEVDVAIAWGPLAGYFARKQRVALEVMPVQPEIDQPFLPFVFDISMGVRRGDDAFKAELEEILSRKRAEIERILDDYNVPRVSQQRSERVEAKR